MLALIGEGGARLATLLLQVDTDGLTSDQKTQIALESLKRNPSLSARVSDALVPFAFFAVVVIIVWLVMRHRQMRLKARMEFNKQLLDKFNSGHELSEFLASEGGQKFLADSQPPPKKVKDRVQSAIRNGILLTAVGFGMMVLSLLPARRGGDHDLIVPGVFCLALGVGFLVTAYISNRLTNRQDQAQVVGRKDAPVS